jgi:hypothetical protein
MIKKTKKLAHRSEKQPKNPRTVFDPVQVRPVTEGQVRQIVTETFPEESINEELIPGLRVGINDALKFLKPQIDGRQTADDIDEIRALLKQLKRKLHPANLKFLKYVGTVNADQYRPPTEAGRKSERRFRPRVGAVYVEPTAKASADLLAMTTGEVLRWLEDRKSCDFVSHFLTPELDLQTVVGHLLPDLFQMCFFVKFGNGVTGPGVRFIVAVLREAGIRSGNEQTTAHYIREARRRMLKSPSGIKKKQR